MKITLTELEQILDERALLKAVLAERASLKQQIIELLLGDVEKSAKVQAAFEKSEAIEAKMRGAVVGR